MNEPMKRVPALVPLSHDHHDGLMRAFRLRRALESGRRALQDQVALLGAFLESSLIPHFRAEEEVLFPRVRALLADDAPLDARIAEHREIESRIRLLALSRGPYAPEDVEALADLLERHIRAEERQLFQECQGVITDPAELDRLETDLRKALDRPVDSSSCSIEPAT